MKLSAPEKHVVLATGLVLAGLVVAVARLPSDVVISSAGTDLCRQFLAWRAFAAANLRAGHLPLWNPYTYSGEPFLSGFQSALFYPPNLLFVILPLCRAANLLLLAHLFILGWGMGLLARRCGLHPYAAALCGWSLALGGSVFPHVFAGHLSNLCTLAWSPWILAGLEDWVRTGRLRGVLWAAAAVCLQITAGHIQYVFYMGIAAGLHAAVRGVQEPRSWRRTAPALLAIYAAGAALSAAQLLPGIAAGAENLRGLGVSYQSAANYSLPPEGLLTLLIPNFFGTLVPFSYWGRFNLWEMTTFAGVTTLVLAAAALFDRRWRRPARTDAAVSALLFILAMGVHTPLFSLLYYDAPGFDRFRGWSKFIFPASIYLILAAGRGADALIKRRLPARWLPLALCPIAAVLAGAGLFFRVHPHAVLSLVAAIAGTGDGRMPADAMQNASVVRTILADAAASPMMSAAILLALAASLLAAGRWPRLRWIPLAILPWEMAGFARHSATVARYEDAAPKSVREFIAAHPGDYRVFNPPRRNNGYLLGAGDIWGDDPGLLRRYAEFMGFSQGLDPDAVDQEIEFKFVPALYSMLRWRYLIAAVGQGKLKAIEWKDRPMARAQLISDYRVRSGRDQLFLEMKKPDFDPAKTVLLEEEPDPRPSGPASTASVRIADDTCDACTIDVDAPAATVLLITDAYSRDWQARPLPGSVQRSYRIMPADYVLRGIPLQAGHHRIRMEYRPAGLRAGLIVSLLAWCIWILAMAMSHRFGDDRGRRDGRPASGD